MSLQKPYYHDERCCKRGHIFTSDNIYVSPLGWKSCKKCRGLAQNKFNIANREKCARKAREYRLRNPKRWADIARRNRWKIKMEIINHYGGKCACCGEVEPRFLSLDHMNGGGNADRKRRFNGTIRGGVEIYRQVKKEGYPNIFRILCHNCNQAIGSYGKCPHAS